MSGTHGTAGPFRTADAQIRSGHEYWPSICHYSTRVPFARTASLKVLRSAAAADALPGSGRWLAITRAGISRAHQELKTNSTESPTPPPSPDARGPQGRPGGRTISARMGGVLQEGTVRTILISTSAMLLWTAAMIPASDPPPVKEGQAVPSTTASAPAEPLAAVNQNSNRGPPSAAEYEQASRERIGLQFLLAQPGQRIHALPGSRRLPQRPAQSGQVGHRGPVPLVAHLAPWPL